MPPEEFEAKKVMVLKRDTRGAQRRFRKDTVYEVGDEKHQMPLKVAQDLVTYSVATVVDDKAKAERAEWVGEGRPPLGPEAAPAPEPEKTDGGGKKDKPEK